MTRKQREVVRVEFTADDLAPVVSQMQRLAAAGDGWVNVFPRLGDGPEQPTSVKFMTLFGGGSIGVTMCTWIPAGSARGSDARPTLGIAHMSFQRVAAQLPARSVPIPNGWFVEQDHPRRGLVVRIDGSGTEAEVLAWGLRAVDALSPPRTDNRWSADIYLPAGSGS